MINRGAFASESSLSRMYTLCGLLLLFLCRLSLLLVLSQHILVLSRPRSCLPGSHAPRSRLKCPAASCVPRVLRVLHPSASVARKGSFGGCSSGDVCRANVYSVMFDIRQSYAWRWRVTSFVVAGHFVDVLKTVSVCLAALFLCALFGKLFRL